MTVALVVLAGGCLAGGLVLLVMAIRGTVPKPPRPARAPSVDKLGLRVVLALGLGLIVALITRWPVGTLLALLLGWTAPSLFGGKVAAKAAIAKIEAIATWTEMLRDTMAAASGLEQAIMATANAGVTPEPIRLEVVELAARLENREQLGPALRVFADRLEDPSSDLVVAALIQAAEQRAQNLGMLLGALADSTRQEVSMRLRVETTRAHARTSARLVTGITLAFAGVLVVLRREYLRPFDSVLGQLVLVLIGLCFGMAFWWLSRMSRIDAPERFLTVDHRTVDAWGSLP